MSRSADVVLDDGTVAVVKTAEGPAISELREEGERLAAAQHPGVVEVLRSSGDAARWDLCLAHAGRPANLLRASAPEQVAAIVGAAASTLADLHDRGIVHGRLEARHLLVGSAGAVRLCGFGASPGDACPADDVAALGAVLVELLGDHETLEPMPDQRWHRRRPWPGVARRSLLAVADLACAEPADHRPTARRLATIIAAAVPTTTTTGTAVSTTVTTPDGPFTVVVDPDGTVLASGWTAEPAALVALVHPDLRPADVTPVADLACAETADHRPTARRLATIIASAVPPARGRAGSAVHGRTTPPLWTSGRQRPALDSIELASSTPSRHPEASRAQRWGPLLAASIGGLLLVVASGRIIDGGPPPPVQPMPRSGESSACAVVEPGDGCQPIEIDGTSVRVGSVRFEVGQPGDQIIAVDWDCEGGPSPAVLRPSTGEVFLFPLWAGGQPLEVAAAAVVPTARAIHPPAETCGPPVVERADGTTVPISEVRPHDPT